MGRGNLIKYYLKLDPTLYPSRTVFIDLTHNQVDAIYIDTVETNANLNLVMVKIEENEWLSAFVIANGVTAPQGKFFKYLYVKWDASQDNQTLVFLFADQGIRLVLPITNYVIISADNAGLAKDSTLQSMIQALIKVLRATVFIVNNLNQPVTVQLIGCRDSSCSDYVNIGSAFTVNANSKDARTLTPDTSGWLPYITVQVQCSTAPTTGTLDIYFIRLANDQAKIVSSLAIRDANVHSFSTDPNNIFIVSW